MNYFDKAMKQGRRLMKAEEQGRAAVHIGVDSAARELILGQQSQIEALHGAVELLTRRLSSTMAGDVRRAFGIEMKTVLTPTVPTFCHADDDWDDEDEEDDTFGIDAPKKKFKAPKAEVTRSTWNPHLEEWLKQASASQRGRVRPNVIRCSGDLRPDGEYQVSFSTSVWPQYQHLLNLFVTLGIEFHSVTKDRRGTLTLTLEQASRAGMPIATDLDTNWNRRKLRAWAAEFLSGLDVPGNRAMWLYEHAQAFSDCLQFETPDGEAATALDLHLNAKALAYTTSMVNGVHYFRIDKDSLIARQLIVPQAFFGGLAPALPANDNVVDEGDRALVNWQHEFLQPLMMNALNITTSLIQDNTVLVFHVEKEISAIALYKLLHERKIGYSKYPTNTGWNVNVNVVTLVDGSHAPAALFMTAHPQMPEVANDTPADAVREVECEAADPEETVADGIYTVRWNQQHSEAIHEAEQPQETFGTWNRRIGKAVDMAFTVDEVQDVTKHVGEHRMIQLSFWSEHQFKRFRLWLRRTLPIGAYSYEVVNEKDCYARLTIAYYMLHSIGFAPPLQKPDMALIDRDQLFTVLRGLAPASVADADVWTTVGRITKGLSQDYYFISFEALKTRINRELDDLNYEKVDALRWLRDNLMTKVEDVK
jgi:hypothetical protein